MGQSKVCGHTCLQGGRELNSAVFRRKQAGPVNSTKCSVLCQVSPMSSSYLVPKSSLEYMLFLYPMSQLGDNETQRRIGIPQGHDTKKNRDSPRSWPSSLKTLGFEPSHGFSRDHRHTAYHIAPSPSWRHARGTPECLCTQLSHWSLKASAFFGILA